MKGNKIYATEFDTKIEKVENAFLSSKWIWVFEGLILLLGLCMFIPSLQNLAIAFGGKIAGHPLHAESWKNNFNSYALAGISIVSISIVFYSVWKIGIKEKNILLCAYILWCVLAFITICLHEPWRDELNVWRILKQFNMQEIFHEMRYEGHFVLWFYILYPFAKLGFPLFTQAIITFFIAAITAWILFWKSPFNVFSKIAFAFSAPFLYWYPVFARPYMLFALLTIILACLYEKRREHPCIFGAILGLITLTHAYAEGFAGMIWLSVFVSDIVLPWKSLSKKEQKNRTVGAVITIVFTLFAFAQVAPAFTEAAYNTQRLAGYAQQVGILKSIASFVLSWKMPLIFVPLAAVIVATIALYLFKVSKNLFLITLIGGIWMLVFSVRLYGAGVPTRASMWLFIILFALWNIRSHAASSLLLLFSLACINFSPMFSDWKKEYSGMKSLSEYIEKNINKDEKIFLCATNGGKLLSVYLSENNFARFEDGNENLYERVKADWGREPKNANECLSDRFAESGKNTVLVVLPMPQISKTKDMYHLEYKCDVLFENDASNVICDEKFYLLKVYNEKPSDSGLELAY